MICSACGFANQQSALFCGGCAAPLPDRQGGQPQAERRVLSVVFCDIVNSTSLSEQIDAEDLSNLVGHYHRLVKEVVDFFDGHIASLIGDGIVIYFGYPMAHEDDEVRAIRCALAIQDAIKTFATIAIHPFKIRIGAHRGKVVVGALGGWVGNPSMAIGETLNVASRLQSEAEPGEVVVSDVLWRLVADAFLAEPLGVRSLKGIRRPVEIYRVLEYRPEARQFSNVPFFVGRAQEMESIRNLWQQSLQSDFQLLLIRGEPGIGKSRLIQEFVNSQVDTDSISILQAFCSPFTTDTPFHPVLELMRNRLGLEGLKPSQKLERLQRRIEELGLPSQDAFPLLARFLALEFDEQQWPVLQELSPVRLRQRTIDLLFMALFSLSEASPLVVILEDLHWADPSTIDLLRNLVAAHLPLRVLILLSSRLEFHAPWDDSPFCSEMLLDSLLGKEAESLIRSVSFDKPMPPDLVRQICSRSAGNPLFLEEVTLSVMESPSLVERDKAWELLQPFSADLVPSSVEAALMSRLDHLGSAKSLLQLAATLGREFTLDLLQAVASIDRISLKRMLNAMVEEGFLRLNGGTPITYSFKHALLQDAAYESLLRSTRQENHARIASVIADQFSELVQARPELLAHHLSGAGRFSEASHHWQSAGQAAAERSAVNEAVDHLLRALADLEQLPQGQERWQRELSLHTSLAPVQMAAFGWASPQVEATCLRAIELAEQLGAADALFAPLWGLWSNQFVSGQLDIAIETARKVHQLAEDSGIGMFAIPAHHASAYTHYYRAEYEQALLDAEQGIRLSSPDQDREIARIFQLSPLAALTTAKGCSLWMQGQQDAGIEQMQQMLIWARSLDHPPSLAGALAFIMHFWFYDRNWQQLYSAADELLELASEEGFYLWRADAGLHRARAALELHGPASHAGDLLEWSELFRQTRADVIAASTTCLIAHELHRQGSSQQALEECLAGEERALRKHVRVMVPEILRQSGDIHRDLANHRQADQTYRAAVAAARSQGARSLELRALTSLQAHRIALGEGESVAPELQQVLAQIVAHHDRADLVAARAVLAASAP